MKRTLLWGMLAVSLVSAGCVVETVDDGGVCEEVSCGDALVNGLDVQGDALCSGPSNAAYAEIFACGCGDSAGPGACSAECGDSLCADAGETPTCGDCLNQFCAPSHNACIAQ